MNEFAHYLEAKRTVDDRSLDRRVLETLRGRLENVPSPSIADVGAGIGTGIERMLDANRPCVDILTQIAASQQALRGVGKLMVRNYLERCAAEGLKSGREQEVYDQLMEIIFKLTR